MKRLFTFSLLLYSIALSGQLVHPVLKDVVRDVVRPIVYTVTGDVGFYYVSTSGDDGNDGQTTSTPWETLEYARDNAAAGATIALKKGDVWLRDNVFEITSGGSSGNHTTWDGGLWGTGDNAVIRSTHDGGGTPYWNNTVRFVACQYVTFQNITVDVNDQNRWGVVVGGDETTDGPTTQNNEHHIIIKDCVVKDVGNGTEYHNGITIRAKYNDIEHITIDNNVVYDIASQGISIYNTWVQYGATPGVHVNNATISSNTVYNIREYRGNTGNGIMITRDCNNVTIEYNTVTTTLGDWAIAVGPVLETWSETDYHQYPDNVIIRYNKIYAQKDAGGARAISIQPEGACTAPMTLDIYGNDLRTNGDGTGGGSVISIDELTGDFSGATFTANYNTIASEDGDNPIRIDIASTNRITVRDNIFYKAGDWYCFVSITNGTAIHSNNLYYQAGGTGNWVKDGASEYNAGNIISGFEATAVVTNPLFASEFDDLHLFNGSPAIGAGVAISGITEDIEGKTRYDPPNIGAYRDTIYPADYYVATWGDDGDAGTFGAPFGTLEQLDNVMTAGDLAYVMGGRYYCKKIATTSILISLGSMVGELGNEIEIFNYPGEQPIMDFSDTLYTQNGVFAFRMNSCSHVHIKGIEFVGLRQNSSNNSVTGFVVSDCDTVKIEMCTVDSIGMYGYTISNSSNHVTFLNCDASNCADPYNNYEGANGFGCTGGDLSTNLFFDGCRAWWCSDDGWDFYSVDAYVEIENCWSFFNGFLPGTFTPAGNGDGNGFKLGPTATDHGTDTLRVLERNLAIQNNNMGYTSNNADCMFLMYNNNSFANAHTGFFWNYHLDLTQHFENNLSYNDVIAAYLGVNIEGTHNTWSTDVEVMVGNNDFISLDSSLLLTSRQSDGSLPDVDFMKLVEGSDLIDAGIDVGLSFNACLPDIGFHESSFNGTIPPTFLYGELGYYNDSIIIVVFDKLLHQDSIPLTTAFTFTEDAVTFGLEAISINEDTVFIALDSVGNNGSAYLLSYTPGYPALQDICENSVVSFSNKTITSNFYLLTDNAVGHWSFEETGAATDAVDEISTNDLSINGGVTLEQTGKINDCYDFDGADLTYLEYARIIELELTSSISVSYWINSTQTGEYASVVGQGKQNYGYAMLLYNSDLISFRLGNDAETPDYIESKSTTDVTTGTWIHVVGTWDEKNSRIYINGELEHTSDDWEYSITYDVPNTPFGVAKLNGTFSDEYDGLFDELTIWNRTLSKENVKDLFDLENAGTGYSW